MFHHFHDDAGFKPGQGSLTANDLERILDYLGPNRVLSAREWARRALANQLSPNDVCLTFDDALRCQYEIALPVLHSRGITAFWFIYTATLSGDTPRLEAYRRFRCEYFNTIEDFYHFFFQIAENQFSDKQIAKALNEMPDDYLSDFAFYTVMDRKFRYVRDKILTPEQYERIMTAAMDGRNTTIEQLSTGVWLEIAHIRDLHAKGHVIGLHSHSHPTLMEAKGLDEQRQEYKTNRDILADIVNESPWTMAHPCNSYSQATLDALRKMGIVLGFRSNMAKREASMLEIPRIDAADVLNQAARLSSLYSTM